METLSTRSFWRGQKMEKCICQGAGLGLGSGAHAPFGNHRVPGNLRLALRKNDPRERNATGFSPVARLTLPARDLT